MIWGLIGHSALAILFYCISVLVLGWLREDISRRRFGWCCFGGIVLGGNIYNSAIHLFCVLDLLVG